MEEDELDESSTDNDDQQSIVEHLIFANQDIKNVENDSSPGFQSKKLSGKGYQSSSDDEGDSEAEEEEDDQERILRLKDIIAHDISSDTSQSNDYGLLLYIHAKKLFSSISGESMNTDQLLEDQEVINDR